MSNTVHHTETLTEKLAAVAVEGALGAAVTRAIDAKRCPPRLASAIRYAVFPGGARLRPRLLAAVALTAGEPSVSAVEATCVALELLHCASLVHDDLPCFDDAATRRGRPALPRAYGEASAVLVGDALIILAFEQLADVVRHSGGGTGALLIAELAGAAGARGGLVAGQAWEMEVSVPLDEYHRAKTGSLFTFACRAGAILAGAPAEGWGEVGRLLGKAYQAADDVADATADTCNLGKPTGQDEALARPSVVRALGLERAKSRARYAAAAALHNVPHGPRSEELRHWLSSQLARGGVLGSVLT